MFVKLAIRNVHRQIQSYLIYFVTVALSISLLFAVNNLSYSDRIQALSEMSTEYVYYGDGIVLSGDGIGS